jgi:hypothetical protein
MDSDKKPYEHIDGFTLEEELRWLESMPPRLQDDALIVELGAWKGRSTGALLSALGPGQTLVAVDTWMGQPSMRHTDQRDAGKMDVFLQFLANMAYLGMVPGWYTASRKVGMPCEQEKPGGFFYLRMDSCDAARNFQDDSLAMVFIDDDHERCEEVCEAWLPKVKINGIVSGHDYSEAFAVVRAAVDKRFAEIRRVGSIWIAPRLYQ